MSKNPNEHFIALARLVSEAGQLASKGSALGGCEAHWIALLITLGKNADTQLKKEFGTYRDSNGRPVVDLEVDGRGVDAFFSAATYDDDGSKVSDDELDYLTETYPETLEEESHQSAVCAAEYACEGDR